MIAIPMLQVGVGDATKLLSVSDVTIIGVLLFIVVLLIGAVVYLFKRVESLNDKRLEEQKEFTTQLLIITEKTSTTVTQVNEILKLTQRNV